MTAIARSPTSAAVCFAGRPAPAVVAPASTGGSSVAEPVLGGGSDVEEVAPGPLTSRSTSLCTKAWDTAALRTSPSRIVSSIVWRPESAGATSSIAVISPSA